MRVFASHVGFLMHILLRPTCCALFLVVGLGCGEPPRTDVADSGVADSAVADSSVADANADAPEPDASSPPDAEADGSGTPTCMPGTRDGAAGATDGLPVFGSVTFNVRTPNGYDPQVAYPLIVTFAPSGGTASFIETATGLTAPATGAGYVIAYVDTVSPVDAAAVRSVAGVADQVAQTWCIDCDRTYLVGSSDGASVAWTIMLEGLMDPAPRAFAPFSAGVNASTLSSIDCPTVALSAMIMHNSGDRVFPGFGASARDWLVACDACDPAGDPLPGGCVPYRGCRDGAEVLYCEGTGGHGSWQNRDDEIIAFFDRH